MTAEASLADGTADSVACLRAALGAAACGPLARLDWVASLPNAAAPGFFYLAGACGGVPVGGGGRDLAEAAARLAGETAEVLAQAAAPTPCDLPGDPAIDALWCGAPDTPRIAAVRVPGGDVFGVPAGSVHPDRPRGAGAPPPSLGLAAGRDRDEARLAGLLELIERDAAAAWWNDGAPARTLDPALAAEAVQGLALLRAEAPARSTSLLELPSRTGVPVVCALSRDAGGGLAFGLKAAADPGTAAAGAVVELMQMEIALEMARLRAARGRETPGDAGPLARAALDPDAFAAAPARALPPVAGCFALLAARLAGLGLHVAVADLPPCEGLAVAKAFAPGLRPLPGDPRPPAIGSPGARAPLM